MKGNGIQLGKRREMRGKGRGGIRPDHPHINMYLYFVEVIVPLPFSLCSGCLRQVHCFLLCSLRNRRLLFQKFFSFV